MSTSDTPQRLAIESALRAFNARYVVVRPGNAPPALSAARCCGGAGPGVAYPPDGYYGSLTHAQQLAFVRQLRDLFWGSDTQIYSFFVKENLIEGAASFTYYGLSDFPTITDAELTLDTYPAKFDLIVGYLKKLTHLLAPEQVAPTQMESKSRTGGGTTCAAAKADAASGTWASATGVDLNFSEQGWLAYPMVPQYTYPVGAVRGKLTAGLQRWVGATAKCYVRLTPRAGGASNAPANIAADDKWHFFENAAAGESWTSGVLSPADPFTLLNGCNNEPAMGWTINLSARVIVVAPPFDNVDDVECDGCATNGCQMGGTSSAAGSLSFSVGLGHVADGSFAGWVMLAERRAARPELATPAALRWAVMPPPSQYGPFEVKVVKTTAGALRQVKTPQGLLDVVVDPNNAYRYVMRFYKNAQVAAPGYDGVYPIVSGQADLWYRQIAVENPDFTPGQPLGAYNRLKITTTTGPGPTGTVAEVNEFAWSSADSQWSLLSGWDAGTSTFARWEARSKVWNGGGTQRTETFTVRNNSSSGAVVQKAVETFDVFAWGEEKTKHQLDPDGADLTTTWTFYTDSVADGVNYRRLKMKVEPSGYWERYSYDASGRIIKTVSQLNGAPSTAADADSRVVEVTYTSSDLLNSSGRPGTDGTADLLETIVEKLIGNEVARRYRLTSTAASWDYTWDIDCPAVGAAWNDAANRVTITKFPKATASNAGDVRPASVLRANGDASAFYHATSYEYGATESHQYLGTLKVDKVKSGVPTSGTPETVRFGTETVTKRHALGEVVATINYPINAGVTDTATAISSPVVPATSGNDYLDDFGQVERVDYLDGTFELTTRTNGRVTSRTNRQGIVTTTQYDALGRATSQTHASGTSGALIRLSTYDAAGRVTVLKRKGTDNVEQTVETVVYDVAGRVKQRTDALGKHTYFTYRRVTDAGNTFDERRAYPHNKSAGPVQVTWSDGEGNTVRAFTGTPASDWAPSAPTGTETLTELSRTANEYDWRGRLSKSRAYHDLATLAFYETTHVYDNLDRRLRTTDGMGNVAANVYDRLDRVVSTWRGTNATGATATNPAGTGSPNDMVKVGETFYDASRDGTGEDRPFVTRARRLKPAQTLTFTHVDFDYDSRRRLEWTKPATGAGPWLRQTYDLGNRPLETTAYQNGSTTYALAKSGNTYDMLGRLTSEKTFEVNGAGGLTGNALESTYAYDAASRRVKWGQTGRGYTKVQFDAVGRRNREAFCSGEGTDTSVRTLTDDTVIEQADFTHDAADNVIQVTTSARHHDGTGTGPLTASNARVSYHATWYDDGHRITHDVNYGTNGGSAFTRPGTPPEPNTSDSYIVEKTLYDASARVKDRIDNRGIVTRFEYDALGRRTKQIENYIDGVSGNDNDRTTTSAYNADGNVTALTAVMPSGTPSQTTTYIYSALLSDKGSPVKANSYLRAVIFPMSDDGVVSNVLSNGTDAVYDRVEMTYHADASLATRKDQNGTVRTFSYDDAGRLTGDAVTTLGSGVDAAVRRIATGYDDLGRPYLFTSFDAPSAGTTVNEVRRGFDGLGRLATEHQEHAGAVNTGTSLKVQYAFDASVASNVLTKAARLMSMTYPNGRILRHEYTTGADDAIARLSYLADDASGSVGTHLEEYSYLGARTIIERKHPEPGVDLTYVKLAAEQTGDAGDKYTGLDRFGRVVDQRWRKADGSHTDRFRYAHDRNGNRLYKENVLSSVNSELYHANGVSAGYDALNRLTDFLRGALSDANTDGVLDTVTTASRTQSWSLDALGNWNTVTTDGTAETRTHDARNRLTAIGGTTLLFDKNGNLTRDETGRTLSFDAWNRLVKVDAAGGANLVTYQLDALGRRIVTTPSGGTARHDYQSINWQVVEEREGGTTKNQYIWSLAYIDAMVVRDRDINGGQLRERAYVQQDPHWNVTGIVSVSGQAVERYVHDAYGVPRNCDPGWVFRSESAYSWTHLHQGGRLDSAWYDFRRRSYAPVLGRWLQPDPLGYAGEMSLYGYVRSNPTRHLDPGGEQSIDEGVWCLTYAACCLQAYDSDQVVLTAMRAAYGALADNDVVNAVQHCTWMCYVASLWCCTSFTTSALGIAHEDGTPNPAHGRAMDLHNNRVGVSLAVNGQGVGACLQKCDAAAKAHQLYWFAPMTPAPGGLPGDFPGFTVDPNGNPGAGVGTGSPNAPGGPVTPPTGTGTPY